MTFIRSGSGHVRRPALLASHVIGPALAAAGEVLAVGDQALVQLAGEHRDAVHPRVMPEPVAGHADLAVAALHDHVAVEIRPFLNRGFNPSGQGRRPGTRNTHELPQMHTPVLVQV